MASTGEVKPAPSKWGWAHAQAELYESSGGIEGTTMRGLPVIILTSTGAKTGESRKTALMRVEHEGRYAAVASKGGAPKHPLWYFNLVANPLVELQDGPQKTGYLAHRAEGAELEEWWARAVEAFPDYADYKEKTERSIPLFVLVPQTS